MGEETTQPTPIDKQEYEAFKNFVRDVHGKTRGHLGSEIENALREYRQKASGADRLQRIEDDIATIKATVAQAESDGGVVAPTSSEQSNTHARNQTKPAPNQPRAKKISYLVGLYLDKDVCNNDGGRLVEKEVQNIVESEYSFDDEIQAEYVEAVYSKIKELKHTRPHPVHGNFEVWGDQLEAAKEDAEKQAESEMGGLVE